MRKNTEVKKSGAGSVNGFLMSLLMSQIAGLAAFFVFVSLCSLLAVRQDLNFARFPYLLLCSCAVSSLTAGFVMSRKRKMRGLLAGFAAALPLVFVEFMILLAASGGVLDTKVYLIIPVMAVCGAGGGVLAANFKSKRR